MNEREPEFSRVDRNKVRKRSNNVLNILIGIVLVLIVVVASIIFIGNDDDQEADEKKLTTEDSAKESEVNDDEKQADISNDNENEITGNTEEEVNDDSNEQKEDTDDVDSDSSVTHIQSDDEVVSETIVDSSWQPIGTTQTGEHSSDYNDKSIDWKEKEQALAYATGLPEDLMIIWKLKNGGSPQKSIGIVSSNDKSNKYRVYLEWVDEQGWLPVKKDILTTLDFDY